MSLANILAIYRANVTRSTDAISLVHIQDANGDFVWNLDQRKFVTDAAFLNLFINWESFLENSYIDYMLGEISINGNAPTRYIFPVNLKHAQEILLLFGNHKFFDWSVPEYIKQIATATFENGFVYERTISSITADLCDMKTIRNSSAHLSSSTSRQLDGLALRKLQRPCQNISVYDLLLSVDPSSPTGETLLQSYCNLLEIAATTIANG